MTRRILCLVSGLVIVMLAGCASAPARLYEAEQHAPADKALIYVYREAHVVGGAVHYMVRANSTDVAELSPGSYFPYFATPGKVELTAATEASTSLTLEVKEGETYYVEGGIGIGFFVGHPRLNSVPASVGAKAIVGCTLAAGATTTNPSDTPGQRMSSGPMATAIVQIAASDVTLIPQSAAPVRLAVFDRRPAIVMERTTIGHTPMSSVVLQPRETDLLTAILAAKLREVSAVGSNATDGPPIECDIDEFSITMPATILYWDVTTDVKLTLRSGAQQQHVAAHAAKRTYAWPSTTLIREATINSLKSIAEQSGPALRALLAAPPPSATAPP